MESSFIPIRHVIFEHRAYLPSVGFCIAITAALFYALKNKTLFVLVMIAWIGMLGFLTVQRNKVWENEIVFWKDVISKSPFKSRGYDNLGAAYIRRNEYEQAVRQFEKALTLDPNNVETYSNLGQAYFQSGENEKALLHFQKASQIDPLSVAVLNNLGKIYEQMGNLQKAETLYLRAIQLKSSFLQPAYNLAGLYRETGKTDQALKIYHQIYEHYPYQTNSLIGMYDIYLKQGEASKAEALIMPLLKKVRSAEELTRLGSLSAQDKRVQEAFAFYLRALERNPEYAPAYIELGKLYGNLNQFDQAIAVWEEGMRRHSKNSEFPLLIKKAKNIRKSYH